MDGTRNYDPEQGNPDTKEHSWYALTDKQILAPERSENQRKNSQTLRSAKKEGQNLEASVSFRDKKEEKENKILCIYHILFCDRLCELKYIN